MAKATWQQTVLHLRSPKEEERALQEKAKVQSTDAGYAAESIMPQHVPKEERMDRREANKEKEVSKAGRARASLHGLEAIRTQTGGDRAEEILTID